MDNCNNNPAKTNLKGQGMANEWKECSLGDVIELKRGYDLPQKERLSGDVPLVSSSGVTDTHAKAMVKGPGVVTGRYGTLGQVFYVRQNFWPLNTTLYVYDFKGNDPRFISYFLREVDFLVYSDKAAVPGLNRNHLHQARVRIPTDPTEQRRIAHILGTLDDKIENNRKTAKTLEAMAQAIFQSWFVDFDPVRAKMGGESPESICKRLKLTLEILDLFPDRLVDSELGEIPEGWGISPLGDLIELAYGKPLKAENRTQGRVPVYGSNGIIGWHDVKLVNGPGIVVGRKGNPGTVIWVEGEFYPIDTTFYVIPKNGVGLRFLYHALMRHDLTALGADSAVPGLNRNLAYISKQLVPHANLCTAFENLTEILFLTSNNLKKQSMDSIEIRDALLPKLISGDIRVQESTLQIEDTLT